MKYYLSSVSLLYATTVAGAEENFMQNYLWTEAGVHSCPVNYDPIRNNAKACSAVSRIFGVRYNRRLNAAVANGKIAYCYVSNVGEDGELSHSSVASSNTDYGISDSLLCRKPRFVRQPINIHRCPAGYVPITNEDRCTEASSALGIGNEPTRNGNEDPCCDVVCFVPFVNGKNELDPLKSTTRLNSNYYSRAAWICERRRIMRRPTAATPGPTPAPTVSPTAGPTAGPTASPTVSPTPGPTPAPTEGPTASSTAGPTAGPTVSTTAGPTALPTANPTADPTARPTPSLDPTHGPTTNIPQILIVRSTISTEGSSADATDTHYLLTDVGVHRCPENSKRINNAAECAHASTILGMIYYEIPGAVAIVADGSVAYCAVLDISDFGGPRFVAHFSKSEAYLKGDRDAVLCARTADTHGPTTARPAPTAGPTEGPTAGPTAGPTEGPTADPTAGPTAGPTDGPTTTRPTPSADPTDATDTHYLRTDAGVHRCPAHSTRIDSVAECARASTALGMRYYAGQDAAGSVAHCAVLDINEVLFSFHDGPSQSLVAFLSYTYEYIDGDKVSVICAP